MTRLVLATLSLCLLSVTGAAEVASVSRNSNLRKSPSTKDKILQIVPANSQVNVISKNPNVGYVRVQTADKKHVGWVLQRNLKDTSPKQEAIAASHVFSAMASRRTGDAEINPDAKMTPGASDESVTQENIADNICNKEWKTSDVRPSTSVTGKIKTKTMVAYGLTDSPAHYELDHLISLQDGGCPDCIENLWPEAYGDAAHPMTQSQRAQWNKQNPGSTEVLPGALEKDMVENHIHDEICYGIPDAKMSMLFKKFPPKIQVTLKRGEEILSSEWHTCYVNMMNGNKPCE